MGNRPPRLFYRKLPFVEVTDLRNVLAQLKRKELLILYGKLRGRTPAYAQNSTLTNEVIIDILIWDSRTRWPQLEAQAKLLRRNR